MDKMHRMKNLGFILKKLLLFILFILSIHVKKVFVFFLGVRLVQFRLSASQTDLSG